MSEPAPQIRVFGIRHHGPGSARAVVAALTDFSPDTVLVEAPADADPLLPLAGLPGMRPPVALLAYAPGAPRVSAFWPFAVFSPEWQALSWALQNGIRVRCCDLPAGAVLAAPEPEPDGAADTLDAADPGQCGPGQCGTGQCGPGQCGPGQCGPGQCGPGQCGPGQEEDGGLATWSVIRADPLAQLAAAAGFEDAERWWDHVMESRVDLSAAPGPFAAITEAMEELRLQTPGPVGLAGAQEARREAYMRTVLRETLKGGATRVAVVCGAWHAPALAGPLPPAAADARVLRGLARRKACLTWVPWTHSRLAASSGYGAGITSPGWYHHLFTAPDRPITRWLIAVARVLRAGDLPVSSADVIEAVRLADTLAAIRGRPLPGLAEVTDATRAVLCRGDDLALAHVTRHLVVGEALGSVPGAVPAVPLDADLRAQARRLRLRIDPAERALDLDLRKDDDRNRSLLLHRLRVLAIPWGEPTTSQVRATGTFRESWRLRWDPGLSVAVIEASVWGSTVEDAAAAKLAGTGSAPGQTLAAITAAVESCLLAGLPAALPPLLAALGERAALDQDVEHLMGALPALVRVLRYGDVRGTGVSSLGRIAASLVVRICAALPASVTALDDDGAARMRHQIEEVHTAVMLAEAADWREGWTAALSRVADRFDVHGLVVGTVVRILRGAGLLDPAQTARRLGLALSAGAEAGQKASWVEGFLTGGGLLLVHDADLLALLDGWVCELTEQDFTDVLPLLRRTFGTFATGERRAIGEAVRRRVRPEGAVRGPVPERDGWNVDPGRARAAVAAVAELLGVNA